MKSKVLIVDDDTEMLLSLEEGLEKYRDLFSVIRAEDGVVATEKLKEDMISLVVTDLKMPRMDGFELLAHIIENYPEIPVIIITAYSTPEMERLARKGGAIGYIEKPFLIDDLAKKILETLRREADGGTLHGISSGMFIQLIEMEQKTCTIRITDRKSGKKGILFFNEGVLMDAKVNGIKGEKALYEIFGWDQVDISIQNTCAIKDRRISSELRAILLDAVRIKDEKRAEEVEEIVELEPVRDEEFLRKIKDLFAKEMGEKGRLIKVYFDQTWESLIDILDDLGSAIKGGSLNLCYLDREDKNDLILIPAGQIGVVEVVTKAPKEKFIKLIMDSISK